MPNNTWNTPVYGGAAAGVTIQPGNIQFTQNDLAAMQNAYNQGANLSPASFQPSAKTLNLTSQIGELVGFVCQELAELDDALDQISTQIEVVLETRSLVLERMSTLQQVAIQLGTSLGIEILPYPHQPGQGLGSMPAAPPPAYQTELVEVPPAELDF